MLIWKACPLSSSISVVNQGVDIYIHLHSPPEEDVKATIRKGYTFQAMHQLPHHDGQCRRYHGHSYEVEIFARGPVRPMDGSPQEGMVFDFGRISASWEAIHPHFEHQFLNLTVSELVSAGFSKPLAVLTTAENLSAIILWQLMILGVCDENFAPAHFNASIHIPVSSVRVWETKSSWAESTREDADEMYTRVRASKNGYKGNSMLQLYCEAMYFSLFGHTTLIDILEFDHEKFARDRKSLQGNLSENRLSIGVDGGVWP